MFLAIIGVITMLLSVLTWIIIIQCVLSFLVAFNVINTYNDFIRSFLNALNRICEPLYRPVRRVLPDFGGVDLSPFVVLILLAVLRMLLDGVALDVGAAYGP